MALLISRSVAGKGPAVQGAVLYQPWGRLAAHRAAMLSHRVLPPEPQHLWDAPRGKGGAFCPALAASADLLSSKLPVSAFGRAVVKLRQQRSLLSQAGPAPHPQCLTEGRMVNPWPGAELRGL